MSQADEPPPPLDVPNPGKVHSIPAEGGLAQLATTIETMVVSCPLGVLMHSPSPTFCSSGPRNVLTAFQTCDCEPSQYCSWTKYAASPPGPVVAGPSLSMHKPLVPLAIRVPFDPSAQL